jgi:nitrogen fixation-related uncharacterized protein
MLWYISSSLALGFSALLVYLYYWKKGQFEEGEDVKYQMFRNDDDFEEK